MTLVQRLKTLHGDEEIRRRSDDAYELITEAIELIEAQQAELSEARVDKIYANSDRKLLERLMEENTQLQAQSAKALFDVILMKAANSDSDDLQRLGELAVESLEDVSPEFHAQWKDITALTSENKKLGAELASLRGMVPVDPHDLKVLKQLAGFYLPHLALSDPMRDVYARINTQLPHPPASEGEAWQARASLQGGEKCVWRETEEMWEADCGVAWTFNNGGPKENSMKYCHVCGKEIAVEACHARKEG